MRHHLRRNTPRRVGVESDGYVRPASRGLILEPNSEADDYYPVALEESGPPPPDRLDRAGVPCLKAHGCPSGEREGPARRSKGSISAIWCPDAGGSSATILGHPRGSGLRGDAVMVLSLWAATRRNRRGWASCPKGGRSVAPKTFEDSSRVLDLDPSVRPGLRGMMLSQESVSLSQLESTRCFERKLLAHDSVGTISEIHCL